MAPSLDGFPAELLGRIAKHLSDVDRRSLGNLRLTCREIHAKTMFQFGSTHFNLIFVYIYPGGFRRLRKVCQHDQFRSRVRKVQLIADPLVYWKEDADSLLESMDSENDSDSLLERSSVDTENDPSPNFDQTVTDFIYNGDFKRYLRACLGVLVNLEYLWIEQPHIRGELTEHEVEILRSAWSEVTKSTLSVIRACKIHLKGLEIENPVDPHCPPDIAALKSISMAPELFDQMTDLSLELYVAKDKRSNSSVPALIQVLKSAKALISLSLSFDRSTRSGKVFSAITRHMDTFPKLRKLSLSQMELSKEALIGFIGISKDTLQVLCLNDMILNSESWKEVFALFLDELLLRQLSLIDLHEGIRGVSFRAIHRERPVVEENWFLREALLPDKEEMDFLQSFSFVTREDRDTYVDLTDGEGEDIREWLSMLADDYDLVHIEPSLIY